MADLCLSCGEYVGQNDESSPYCKCDREKLKEIKEDAEHWRAYIKASEFTLMESKLIVERLKKYLKNIDADILDKEKVCLCDECGCEDSVRDAIRKILEGEK